MTYLTVKECADTVRMSPDFIRDQIKIGRLNAKQYTTLFGRTRYRIAAEDFQEWRSVYWKDTASV